MADDGGRAGRAMVLMAFLAVLREGFETVVFLLAAFNESGNSGRPRPAARSLGIVVAVALGYGIYRGGVRLNLSKFFRATGLVLVLVAAGPGRQRAAHRARGGLAQRRAELDGRPDLAGAARLGAVVAAHRHARHPADPVLIEVVGWLAYLVPVGLYVAWPPRRVARRTLLRITAALAAVGVAATVVLLAVAPGTPAANPATAAGSLSARLAAAPGQTAVVRTIPQSPAADGRGRLGGRSPRRPSARCRSPCTAPAPRSTTASPRDVYTASTPGDAAADRPDRG